MVGAPKGSLNTPCRGTEGSLNTPSSFLLFILLKLETVCAPSVSVLNCTYSLHVQQLQAVTAAATSADVCRFCSVQGIVFTDDERVFQMREWNRIEVWDGPGAGWQGEGEGRQGVGEGGHDGACEQNGSDPDNMLTITVQVQP